MIYNYITSSDLKQLDENKVKKLVENYQVFVFAMDIDELRRKIVSNQSFSKLYEEALKHNKMIITIKSPEKIVHVDKYLKFNKVEAKKILVITNK